MLIHIKVTSYRFDTLTAKSGLSQSPSAPTACGTARGLPTSLDGDVLFKSTRLIRNYDEITLIASRSPAS